MVMPPDFRLPPALQLLSRKLRTLALKKQQRLRDLHHDEAARLRQQAQEMQQLGHAEDAQELLRQAQRHEQEERTLSDAIKKHFAV